MSTEKPDIVPPQPLPDWMNSKPSDMTSAPNPFGTSAGGPPKNFLPPKPPVFHPDIQSMMKNKLQEAPTTSSSSKMENPFAPKAKSVSPTPASHTSHRPPPVPPNTAVPSPQPEPEEPLTPKPGELEVEPVFPAVVSPSIEIPLSPPIGEKPITAAAVISTTENSTEPVSSNSERKSSDASSSQNDRVDMTGGFVSWFTKAVAESKLLSDVAEKAKIGMEQVLTTLDPGMKGFLSEDGGVDMYMVNSNMNAVKSVRDGFERVFANVLIRTVPAPKVDPPVLINGSADALEACHDRITRLRNSKLIPQTSPIVVLQPFIMDMDGVKYSSTRLLFSWKEHSFDSIAQLLKVDEKLMDYVKKRSVMDGKTGSEYSITLSQAAKEVELAVHNWSSVEQESWAGPTPPYSFSEHLVTAASALALDFMNLNLKITSEALEASKESTK